MDDIINLHLIGGININKIPAKIKTDVKEYFSSLYTNMIDRILRDKDVTLSEVFHILVGAKIFSIKVDAEIVKKFIDSCQFGNGYLPTNKEHSLYGVIETGNKQEDIYSTYYALMSLILIGKNAKLNLNLLDYKQESNLIYNYGISETIEERRLHSEIFISNLLAIKLIAFFDKLMLAELPDNVITIVESILNHKYLSLILYSCEVAHIMKYEIPNTTKKYIESFISNHFDETTGGFYEYTFEDVKRDENRGRLQRFAHDVRVPSISATYAAIQIGQLADIGSIKELIINNKVKINLFLQNSQCLELKGFGTEIKIARMPGLFGKKATPWETLMAVKSLELLNSFKN